MESPGKHIQKTTVDRKVFVSVVVIGAIAVFMLVVQIVHRMGWDSGNEDLYFWAEFAAEIAVILAIARVGTLALKEMTQRRRETLLALEARTQVETLFEMTDMLQSALGYSDANAVLRATAAKLLPGFGGALYVFNNSGDRLELSTVGTCPGRIARLNPFRRPGAGLSNAESHISIGKLSAHCVVSIHLVPALYWKFR